MSCSLSYLARVETGVNVWCWNPGCSRLTTYVPPDELLAKFGDLTCEEAQRRVRCTTCGAHGRDGKIEVLQSTLDIDDQRHGRPPGTTERRMEARRAETAAIIAAEKARYAAE